MQANPRRPLRILYFTQYTFPDPGAPAVRSFDFSRMWAESGHEVTVVAAVPGFRTGAELPGYQVPKFIHERSGDVRFLRCPLPSVGIQGPLKQILGQAVFAGNAAVLTMALCRRWKPDVVLASVPELSVLLPALTAVYMSETSFILEVRDIWPDELVSLGFPSCGPLPFLVESVLKTAYLRADHVVTVTKKFGDRLRDKGVSPAKMTVVPHGADLSFFRPLPRMNWLREEHGWGEDIFVLLYAGNMGRAQGIDMLVQVARNLPDSIKIVLIGSGNQRSRIQRNVRWNSFGNIVVLPSQPRASMPWVYAAADAVVVPLKGVPVLEDAVPSKLAEIMACGKPVIASLAGVSAELVERAGAGIVVEPDNLYNIVRAAIDLSAKPKSELLNISHASRTFAEKYFNRHQHAMMYEKILLDVAES
ncbi:MAG: glycosyltransferase family 4 protein [bacterium]|nr:glycosyltransferase family 4 protein [bacterium]